MPLFENIFSAKRIIKKEKPKLKLIADLHEKNSMVISELADLSVDVEFKNLPVADYLIKDIAIERKTINDFVNSMINKRLTRQLEEIKQYPKHLLLIEGADHQELYDDSPEGVHGNAIRGFLLSIILEYQVPIIFTKDSADTAKFLYILAKKPQEYNLGLRAKKKSRNKKEQMQFILEGFPGIGPKTAKKLLKKYNTIKNIINAPLEELKAEIGKKAEIFTLAEKSYQPSP
ncbi:MAG: ERCC4 domain-containing protein [archaeon]